MIVVLEEKSKMTIMIGRKGEPAYCLEIG